MAGPPVGLPSWPSAHYVMTLICKFNGTLTVIGKSFKKHKNCQKCVWRQRLEFNPDLCCNQEGGREGFRLEEAGEPETWRLLLISTAGVSDWLVTIRKLAKAHGVHQNLSHPLHKDLNLSKKSARWVSKLLNDDMKKEQVRTIKGSLPWFAPT